MQLFTSLTDSEFLIIFSGLIVAGCVAAWLIPSALRDAGRRSESLDPESIAVLAGGRERFADAVLARLFVAGVLEFAGSGGLRVVRRDPAAGTAALALLDAGGPLTLGQARRIIDRHRAGIVARMRRSGLMLWPEQVTRMRWLSIAPFAVLLVLGIYRYRAASAFGAPSGGLLVLLAITLACAVLRYLLSDPRTVAGIGAVRDVHGGRAARAHPPAADEAPLAVALFGTEVLIGTPWEPVHRLCRQLH